MHKSLLAVLAVLLIAGSAPAINVGSLNLAPVADTIASQLSLNLALPESGLAAFWPGEIEKLADLPPIVASIKDPAKLNAAIGEGGNLKKGDFVVLNAQAGGFGAKFYGRGAAWTGPDLAARLEELGGPGHFFDVFIEVGLGVVAQSEIWPHFDGMLYQAIITDAEKFGAAFAGEGEAVKGQTMILTAGISGTTARFVQALSNPIQGFGAAKGAVEVIKK